MKPDWKDAPKWANWLAMDADGVWYWYELLPLMDEGGWYNRNGSVYEAVIMPFELWRPTLEGRPQTPKPAEAGSEGQPGA